MKKIYFMDTSFRDGFQSCYGARVKTEDFLPALEAAVEAGTKSFEIGGGARFQSLYFYCQEDAFDSMDACRKAVGPDVNLQTLSRGANVVGLKSYSRDIINLHAKMFKKHGVTTIRNFDALNDVRNLAFSGKCIRDNGLKHQVTVTLMGVPPGLEDKYPHSPKFYTDCLKKIMETGIPYDSVCFKDASGTATPKVVYETILEAKKILPKDKLVQFHTHDTAGMGASCYMAAIEAGVDIIDLSMQPTSGGTCSPDILTMWHRLRGTEYTLDIDYEKYLKAEEVFMKCMEKYFIPPEAKEVSPIIPLSPMPGGALTANTQMMRDTQTLHLYPEVIKAMREVVARGGFGTSVTPVSQFYFQQAFSNVTQGAWAKISDGYGKMVLGYFGKTPAEPDAEIVKLAETQLGLKPTTEDVHDINDRNTKIGIKTNTAQLKEAGLPVTDENIFIVAMCEDKGIEFLKGNKPMGIRYIESKKPEEAPAAVQSSGTAAGYTVIVNGVSYDVVVAEGSGQILTAAPSAARAKPAQSAPVSAPSGNTAQPSSASPAKATIKANLPGKVMKLSVQKGAQVKEGDVILVLEAMKMETPVTAPASGILGSFSVAQGEVVKTGQVLAVII